jgi:hypothetical protein
MAKLGQSSQEIQARVKQAEDRLLQAQNSQSAEEQEAAMKELQEVRKEQGRKLTEIALEARAQQEALQQIKGAGQ